MVLAESLVLGTQVSNCYLRLMVWAGVASSFELLIIFEISVTFVELNILIYLKKSYCCEG